MNPEYDQTEEELFAGDLVPGETILWAARELPPRGIMAKPWWFLVIGICSMAAGIGLCSLGWHLIHTGQLLLAFEPRFLIILAMGPLLLIGGVTMAGLPPLMGRPKEPDSHYAVTNRRVLILRTSLIRVLDAFHLDSISVKPYPVDSDGVGTVSIYRNGSDRSTSRAKADIADASMMNIPNAYQVADLIDHLRSEAAASAADQEAPAVFSASSGGIVEADLLPGEVIQWSGQPALVRRQAKLGVRLTVRAILEAVLGLGIEGFGVYSLIHGHILIFAVCLLVGYHPLVSAFAFFWLMTGRLNSPDRTWYAVTNKRVLSVEESHGRHFTAFDLNRIACVELRNARADGCGDLFFRSAEDQPGEGTMTVREQALSFSRKPHFMNVPDAEVVAALVDRLREAPPQL